jgi:hypothetical protein
LELQAHLQGSFLKLIAAGAIDFGLLVNFVSPSTDNTDIKGGGTDNMSTWLSEKINVFNDAMRDYEQKAFINRDLYSRDDIVGKYLLYHVLAKAKFLDLFGKDSNYNNYT